MDTDKYICSQCEKPCEVEECDVGNYEEFWGAPVWRAEYELLSDCCHKEVATFEEWEENDWPIVTEELRESMDEWRWDRLHG